MRNFERLRRRKSHSSLANLHTQTVEWVGSLAVNYCEVNCYRRKLQGPEDDLPNIRNATEENLGQHSPAFR
jgi:hypothetical protein